MLRAVLNAFKIPDLRKKILFTLFIIAVFRLGSFIPIPNVGVNELARQSQAPQQGILSFINLFSGGALGPLAVLQSAGLILLFDRQFPGSIRDSSPPRVVLMIVTLTAGTAFIMWLGELITQRGIGNGMSILIFTSVISRLPFEGAAVLRQGTPFQFGTIVLLGLAIIVAVVFMEQGQRRIPVQYAKRIVGRRMTSGGSTYIPLKVNQAGVIPIIFASSVLYFPTLLGSVVPWQGFENFVNNVLLNQGHPVYIVLYGLMVVFFAYFYTAITFNPIQTADNIRKYGGVIPGHPPGRPTAEHLDHILTRITLPGSLFLASIALIPSIAFIVMG